MLSIISMDFWDKNVKILLINMDIVKGEIRLSKTNKKLRIKVCFVSLGN
jgi:hypothetical protein